MRIFLIVTILIFHLNAQSFFSNSYQEENSKYIGALKDLIISTQKTRGLTNSFLNGNVTSLLFVYNYREDMKKAIGVMESLPLASDPIINSRATSISQSLIELNRKAMKSNAKSVFEEYTELIEQTLMLAQTVSKRGSQNLNPLGEELSTIMMETILPLSEYVGQMRGLGSGIIAKGDMTSIQISQIQALISTINRLSLKLIDSMQIAKSKHKQYFGEDLDTKLSSIEQSSKNYIALTKKEILNKKKILFDADFYFNEGTDLILLVVDVYNINNKVILEDAKGWF